MSRENENILELHGSCVNQGESWKGSDFMENFNLNQKFNEKST